MTDENLNMYAELPESYLQKLLVDFAANPKIVDMVTKVLQGREAAAKQLQLVADFDTAVATIVLPNPPAGVHNLYCAWREVSENVGEPVAVTVGDKTEMRQETRKVWKWVIQTNYAINLSAGKTTTSGTATTETKTRKLAITVSKIVQIDGKPALEAVGNFRNGKEACKHLGLDNGASSANLYLGTHGYAISEYTGTDFLVKES